MHFTEKEDILDQTSTLKTFILLLHKVLGNVMLSLQELDFGGVHHKQSSSDEMSNDHFHGAQDWAVDSDVGFYHNMYDEANKYQQDESFSHFVDDLHYNMMSPPIQACLEEISKLGPAQSIVELTKGSSPFSSLQILQNYGAGFKRMSGEKRLEAVDNYKAAASRELSTEDVLKVAGAKFIQGSSPVTDIACDLSHPFGLYFSGLSDEETRDVELAEFLLAAAEKVGNQQFERARRLLNQYDDLSCGLGNPVQRLVFHFSEALRDKIDRESGRPVPYGLGKQQACILEEAIMAPTPTMLACHEDMPFSQVFQFAAIQAIVENVSDAKKVHILDLAIRNGVQWTAFMQALVARHECPLELLTITAVGTAGKSVIEDTGARLASFARSLNLPFCFKIVMVLEMQDLKEDQFEIREDESVVVYAQLVLRTMIAQPNQLESLMTVVRNINPCIMLLQEVESNHNSPVFVNRFIEALFYFGAFFDCLEACMARDDPNRTMTESYFRDGIRNIVAAEGEERSVRSVKIDVWRAFLTRFGMVEAELSASSLYQANLVLKKFACGSSCTLDMNGKSLIIGWKGTPIHSLSVWNFL